MAQSTKHFEADIPVTFKFDYLLYLPEGYDAAADEKWPLVLFLHGAGERGSDIEKVKVHGIPKLVESGKEFPFIAVSPQCPEFVGWWTAAVGLRGLLEDIMAKYKVDEDRVYVTGLSMGGFGTFNLAIEYPEMFAAIAPICGGGDPARADRIKDIPTWVFHGAKDDVVALEQSENMVEALKACGGNVKFTVYPEAMHDSWTETYDNPELYEWMLAQKRK